MLKHNWVNKNKKYAFSGISKIYEHYKGGLKVKDIKEGLSEIPTYTRHKEGKKTKIFNPFYVRYVNEMWQADIMYLPDYKETCKGYKYLLCVLDVFSRKLFIRKLRKKDTKSVIKEFDDIHKEVNSSPEKIVVDKGSEFKSESFQQYTDFFGIQLIFTYNETKAAHVERAQRSYQNILYRILEEHQTRDFLKYLNIALSIYNNRKNRIIGCSPNFAFQKKHHTYVSKNLGEKYNNIAQKRKSPSFKEKDYVRIRELKKTFSRGYHPYFTEEIFKIKKVLTNLPIPRYILSDYTGDEEIKGTFYEREITKVTSDTFKIEKILKTKRVKGKTQYFVKWLGYPSSQNSWIDASWSRKIR
jgi:hypothetical protein